MKNNISKTKILIIAVAVVIGGFWLQAEAKAQSNLVNIQFEAQPLFSEANILPGDSVSRWVKVNNVSGENQPIAAKISYYEDIGGLGSQLALEIGSGADVYYSAYLSDFFSAGEVYLSDLPPGIEKQYDFTIEFADSAGNSYQGKSLNFDIMVGSQAGESLGGGSGGSGGFVYNNLIIFNEAISVSNTSATITWETNMNATSRVIYDTASHPDISAEEPPLYGYAETTPEYPDKVIYHNVAISGLAPNTVYYFRPVSKASPEKYGIELSFATTNSADDIRVLGESGAPDLLITKTGESEFANPGDIINFKVTIENQGELPAFNASLRDELPDGFVFLSNSNGTRVWDLGDINAGGFISLDYSVKIDESVLPGEYNNFARAGADNSDPISARAGVEVRPIAVLGSALTPSGFSLFEFLVLLDALLAAMVLAALTKYYSLIKINKDKK